MAVHRDAPPAHRLRSLGRALLNPSSALTATAWFAAVTVVMTWPLVRGLARDIPWDLGDSLLNCWILGWDADHLLRFLTGDLTALAGFWNANIFHPAPLALAYSEHLVAQAVQILPVYALTRNLILCYNLLFLSSFVLAALGTYLFVRDLTGDARAGVLAGLAFGFALYRVGQLSHLQVLSAQWMPFVFVGLRRHLESGRIRPLVGGLAALVAQNLSCGYYLLYFAPFVPAYVLYEMWIRGRLGDLRLWARLLAGAAVVALATWPFIQPYSELRAEGFRARSISEVERFSADVLGYATAAPLLRVWGPRLQTFGKAEGQLFPGVVPVLFAAILLGLHAPAVWRRARERPKAARRLRVVVVALALIAALSLLAALLILVGRGFVFEAGPVEIRVLSLPRSIRIAALALLGLLAISPRARAFTRGAPGSVVGFFAVSLVAAFALSLGPTVTVGDVRLCDGWYLFLYQHVPGFDGLRVPARMAMVVALFLAVLGGLGAARLAQAWKRAAPLVWVACAAFLIEATAAPIGVNVVFEEASGLQRLSAGVETRGHVPPVYEYLASLNPDAVILELPFGDPAYDLRYMYYSTFHWRRLVNGYSGGFPPWWPKLRQVYRWPFEDPDAAYRLLFNYGVTRVVVHEGAFSDGAGPSVSRWLRSSGASEVAAFGDTKVFTPGPLH